LLAAVLVIVMPAAVSMALVAPDLVALLYGPAWADTGWILALMFLCLPAWAGWGVSTPVLWNTGRKHLEARLQWPLLIIAVPAWWLLAPYGLGAVVAVTVGVTHVRAVLIIGAGLRGLGLPASSLLPLMGRGALLSLGCGLATLAAQSAAEQLSLPPTLHAAAALAAGSLAALTTGLLVAWTLPSLLGPDARQVLARVLPFMQPAPTVASAA
jgi:O-antigen/teichoic acid export membrane protein